MHVAPCLHCLFCLKIMSNHRKSPKFKNPDGGKDIDFRRLLLNKCQEEFEKGSQVCVA